VGPACDTPPWQPVTQSAPASRVGTTEGSNMRGFFVVVYCNEMWRFEALGSRMVRCTVGPKKKKIESVVAIWGRATNVGSFGQKITVAILGQAIAIFLIVFLYINMQCF